MFSAEAAVDRLAALVRGRVLVALTGAGVSTESGIPDYRSPEALARGVRRPIQGPEFARSPSVRRRYWARAFVGWGRLEAARPGPAHVALADLESAGVVRSVITQNVDGLHQAAGSRNVIELHGSMSEVRCLECGTVFPRAAVQASVAALNAALAEAAREAASAPDGDADLPDDRIAGFQVPVCASCGGVLKPNVVFFGDSVPRPIVEAAFAEVDAAGVLLIAGTSLAVFSGYRFLLRAAARPIPIAIVNRGEVRGEASAALKLESGTGATLTALARLLRG